MCGGSGLIGPNQRLGYAPLPWWVLLIPAAIAVLLFIGQTYCHIPRH